MKRDPERYGESIGTDGGVQAVEPILREVETGDEDRTEQAEDALVAAIRQEIETAGHSTVTWGGFERLGGLSEAGAKDWTVGFCARPDVGLRATLHDGGIGFWPDEPGRKFHDLIPTAEE